MSTSSERPAEQPSRSTRMCVGCRLRDERDALARVVRGPDGVAVVDLRRRLPGRGASVHARRKCIETAVHRQGLVRAIGATAPAEQLLASLVSQYEARLVGLILAARRAGRLELGTDAVAGALAERRVDLLLIAEDAQGRRRELEALAAAVGAEVVVWGAKARTGKILGRAEVAVAGLCDRGMAIALRDAALGVMSLDDTNRFAEDA